MRHLKAGRKLGGDADYRRAMMRSLTLALIEHETIRTTPARAKELRWFADRVVTLAKRGNLAGRRRIVQILGSTKTNEDGTNRVREAVDRVYSVLVPRFQTRPGGYTQIFRLAHRRPGDNAEMCIMRYIPALEENRKGSKGDKPVKPTKKVKAASRKEAKKTEASDKPTKKTAKAREKAEHQDKE